MTSLKPLRESSRDDFSRNLLESALLDEPPRHSLRKTAVFLGVGEAAAASLAASTASGVAPEVLGAATALGGTATAATGALSVGAAGALNGSGATAAGALSASAGGAKLALLGTLKWLGAGAIVGAVTAGGVDYAVDIATPAAPATVTTAVPGKPSESRLSPTQAHESGPSPVAQRSEGAARAEGDRQKANAAAGVGERAARLRTATDPAPNSQPASATRPPNDTPELDAEIRRLDRARTALGAGNSEQALAELAAYEQERKTAVLQREATILRIDALLAQGDREGARTLARRYVTAHPGDPHARRLRSLLEPEGVQR